ncbi:hypothetical protein [Intestinimonas butyriciproducens]|uniref:hypothetical protein n=1 Tax=Intestinimonas butyriciproducens TaxID=1297617 RepID=UPI001957B864|nr:hypothetical protein [Intestinimonas butyriciproducens]MBM6977388.1 hypothetical protein [Intestinimonas butyriciproducens]
MGNTKLMPPLFYRDNFNTDGKKMRVLFLREVSNGTETYRLWRRDGKPDREYPQGEGDAYILYVEQGGYLAPLRMTDYYMVNHCGYYAAVAALYGDEDNRGKYFGRLRQSGGDPAVLEALGREERMIQECGSDPARQASYIKAILDGHVATYLTSKENGGETFPDFIGALVLGELPVCVKLSAVYKAQSKIRAQERMAKAEAEAEAYCKERNRQAEQQVQEALRVIREGGVLRNDTVEFCRSRYDSSASSIILYLMRQYQVEVPLRTQGWINERLANATITDGRCSRVQFRGNKRSKCSSRFFDCMNELIRAAIA